MDKLKLGYFGDCQITCLISGGKRKLHCTYKDGTEKVEEYDRKTHELLTRKYKKQSTIKETKWIYEIGEQPQDGDIQMKNSSKNPVFTRKDTQKEYCFRIRNLMYPQDVYTVEIDNDQNQIVVKTSNKKYFKRIELPDVKTVLSKEKLNWTYQNQTLIISYQKPETIIIHEQLLRKEFDKLNAKKNEEGDIECVLQ